MGGGVAKLVAHVPPEGLEQIGLGLSHVRGELLVRLQSQLPLQSQVQYELLWTEFMIDLSDFLLTNKKKNQ